MKIKLKGTVRRALFMGLSILTVATAIVSVAPSELASAVTCREQRIHSVIGWYDTGPSGETYQVTANSNGDTSFNVPGSSQSGCSYVNVKNVTGGTGSNGTCWWFRVKAVSFQGSTWYPQTYACAGSTTVTGIAGPIANGTTYLVYILPNDGLQFTLRD